MRQQIAALGKNTLIYGIGTVLARFLHLLLLPLFTAYLSPVDYGVISLLALLNFFAQPVFSIGFGSAIGPSYFEGNSEERKSQTTFTAFLILLFSSVLLSVLAWMFALQISSLLFQKSDYFFLVQISLWGCSLNILAIPFQLRLQFENRPREFAFLTILTSIINIVACVVGVVILEIGVTGMVMGQLIGSVVCFLSFFVYGIKGVKFRYSRDVGKELFWLGLPMIPSSAFVFILLQINRYLLQHYRGLEEVGIYSVGFSIGMAMNLAVGSVSTAWYPFFMSYMERQSEAKVLFGRIFTYYVYGIGALCGLFFITAKVVIKLMTQPAFHEAYAVVGFAASSVFLTGVFNMLLPGVYFSKELKYVSVIQGFSALIAIGLNALLVKQYGLFGAGLALLASHLIMVLLQCFWNLYRKSTYIAVEYEWHRLKLFGLLMAFVIVVSIIDRPFMFHVELAFVAVLSLSMVFAVYCMLNSAEKSALKNSIISLRSKILNG